MKSKFTWLSVLAVLFMGASALFISSCQKDEPSEVVQYSGKVVYAHTTNPFPDCLVQVTDGSNIHCMGRTDAAGSFSLMVKVDDINGNYYFSAGDATCIPTRRALSGYGQSQVDLGTIEVEGPALPVVTTKAVSNITAESANCGGTVVSDGRLEVTARGVCWATTEEPTLDNDYTTNGTGKGEFQSKLTNLERGETYYVRAYATNAKGTAYGEQITFTTNTGLPQVTTADVSNILATSATCGGNVTSNGGFSITARGICWSKISASPTIQDAYSQEVGTTGTFTSTMINLDPSTTYYVRAYATNSKGTNYGETKTFTTTSGLPVVTTALVSEVKATTALCGGNVTSNGGFSITARGICWSSTSSTPTVSDNHTSEVADNGAFTSLMTNLSVSTTYYVRAYATNEMGTVYGETKTFSTANGLPTVQTTIIGENVTETTAVSGGQVTDDGGFNVTARGVCWSTFPYPTISDNKTTNGSGTGYFSSSITGINLTGNNVYYVRAYATNANGTSYGNQVVVSKENYDYKNLPAIEYAGYVYRLYVDMGAMTWDAANTACENMVYGGYDDWALPTKDEILHIMTSIHQGWYFSDGSQFVFSSGTKTSYPQSLTGSANYWTSTAADGTQSKYSVGYFSGTSSYYSDGYRYCYHEAASKTEITSNSNRVRPVRKYKKGN